MIGFKYITVLTCPYCYHKYPDSEEIEPGEQDIGEIICNSCGKTFYATRHIHISYSTETME